MTETSKSVGEWCNATFRRVKSKQRIITRALQELAELQNAYDLGESNERLLQEASDVAICLMRLAYECNSELFQAIDEKMAINRKRKWRLDGSGNAQHIKD